LTRRPPVTDWPTGDRELWNRALEPGGLFGGGGRAAHWSAASRLKVACGYKAWLAWLAAKKLLNPDMRPADRVAPERLGAYIAELQAELAPYTVLCRVQELHDALRVMEPESNCKWLTQAYRSLKAQVRPARDKLSRLKTPEELIALGKRLMDEAETATEGSSRRRAVCYRDGLLICVLTYRLMRRKNLAMMRFGRHLVKVGGSEAYWGCFAHSRPRRPQDDRKALQSCAEPRSLPPPRRDAGELAREPEGQPESLREIACAPSSTPGTRPTSSARLRSTTRSVSARRELRARVGPWSRSIGIQR
jgi:hypothetical protein